MRGYCHNCAAVLTAEARVCPRCGYDSGSYYPEPHFLLPETVLAERYRIGRVLGGGGFGITYVGVDTVLNLKVAIKEFYMTGFVTREALASPALRITGGTYGEDFIRNRDRFLDEARVLARFAGEPGIVMVRDFFTANNTAYIVMEFLDGETLADHLKKTGPLPWEETERLMRPVLNTLSRIHRQDIIHRDISPDNIMMTSLGQVKLLDFGAARDYSGQADRSLSVILKHGYAPVEQNSRNRGIQGPWTDVYALCATMYRCLTGRVPEDAMERINEDTVVPPCRFGRCSRPVSDVLMKGLELRRKDRWQSADELAAALEQAAAMPAGQPFFAPPPAAEGNATVFSGGAAPQQPPAGSTADNAPNFSRYFGAAAQPGRAGDPFGASYAAQNTASAPESAAASAAPPVKVRHRGLRIFGLVMLAIYALLILRLSCSAMDLVDYWLHNSFGGKIPFMVPTVVAVVYPFFLLASMVCWVTNFLLLTTVARKPWKPFRKPLADRKKRQTVFGGVLCIFCAVMQVLCILSGETIPAYAYCCPMIAAVPLWTMVRCCVLPPERSSYLRACIQGLILLGFAVSLHFLCEEGPPLYSTIFAAIAMLMLAVLAVRAPMKQTAAPTYRYYTCGSCGKKLRVPQGKGLIRVRCPGCGREFMANT